MDFTKIRFAPRYSTAPDSSIDMLPGVGDDVALAESQGFADVSISIGATSEGQDVSFNDGHAAKYEEMLTRILSSAVCKYKLERNISSTQESLNYLNMLNAYDLHFVVQHLHPSDYRQC